MEEHIEKERTHIYKQASSIPDLEATMQEEMNFFLKNVTLVLVPLPKVPKTVHCKWVYITNFPIYGSLDKFKTRLVSQVFST